MQILNLIKLLCNYYIMNKQQVFFLDEFYLGICHNILLLPNEGLNDISYLRHHVQFLAKEKAHKDSSLEVL